MNEEKIFVINQFNTTLNSYRIFRKKHNSIAFMALSQLISSSNYLGNKDKIDLVQNAVLGNDIEMPSFLSDDILNAVFKRRYEYEINVRELLYTILYLDDCDINMLWEKFTQTTPDEICFYNNDIFSIDYGREVGMIRGEDMLQVPPVSALLLNSKINMINDDEIKRRVMMRFNPELMEIYSKVRKKGNS